MRAELRSLASPDAPEGLDAYRPEDPAAFAVAVDALIGPAGSAGSEQFSFRVVGTDWFGQNPPGKGFRWGRHYLILDRWDADVVRRAISDLCLRTEGSSWDQIASRLASFGSWEFEGYLADHADAGDATR